jgi:transcriptional antiterminator NusG
MSWYAVHTRSRHEDRVLLGLEQKSINVYLPKLEVWSKRKDRQKKITIPMFAGYLFVEIAVLDNQIKLDVLKTFGVVGILGKSPGSEPLPVPDAKIDAIRRIVDSKIEVWQFQHLKVGQPAMIIDGPFKGIEGYVLRIDYEKEIFVVEIEFLKRTIAIKLEGFKIARL